MTDLYFRPATADSDIWQSVAGLNEYELPDRFHSGATIVDIGAHIGAFTYSCLDRGASLVVAVEADNANSRVWQHNIQDACQATDRSILITAACWRPEPKLTHVQLNRTGSNTGGSHVLANAGHPVITISLDDVIALSLSVSKRKRLRMLKLDCEGSEWEILYSSKSLKLVDEIVGEYHLLPDIPKANLKKLEKHLTRLGFRFSSRETDPRGLGLFWAKHNSVKWI